MSIQGRMVAALLGVALGALVATGGYAYWRAYTTIVETQRVGISAVSQSRAERLGSAYRDWLQLFDTLAADRLLGSSLQLYGERAYSRYRRRISRILSRMRTERGLESLTLRQDAKVVATAGVGARSTMGGSIELVSSAQANVVVTMTSAVPSGHGTLPLVTLSGPVEVDDQSVGTLSIQIRAERAFELVQSSQGLGQRGNVMIVVRAKDGAWHSLASTPGATVVPMPGEPPPAGSDVLGHWVGDDYLQAGARVTPFMGVLVASAADEMLRPANDLRLAIVAFALIVTVLVAIVGVWLARGLTAGIRDLSDVARAIHAGDLSRRAEVLRNDEIGVLAGSFNAMAEELIAANARLEERVQQRTAALESRAQELARSNAELEQFASVASHDLQEPLRKVQAFGDRLQMRYADTLDPRARDYIERMQSSASRMRVLIEDLLSYSRVSTGAGTFEPVDLDAVLTGVLQDLDVAIQEASAHIEVDTLPCVEGDRTQLRQLLQNLIGNALKYAKDDEPARVVVRAESDGAQVTLTVADNGIGFDESYSERIFGIFQRLHGRDKYEGTGVGLAICKRIVERHNGRITVQSAEGEGSTFSVTLPLRQPRMPDGDAQTTGLPGCSGEQF